MQKETSYIPKEWNDGRYQRLKKQDVSLGPEVQENPRSCAESEKGPVTLGEWQGGGGILQTTRSKDHACPLIHSCRTY